MICSRQMLAYCQASAISVASNLEARVIHSLEWLGVISIWSLNVACILLEDETFSGYLRMFIC